MLGAGTNEVGEDVEGWRVDARKGMLGMKRSE